MFVAWILLNEVYIKGLLQNEVEVRRAEVRHAPLSGAARLPVGTLDARSKPKYITTRLLRNVEYGNK
jgi:hypothetical protein